jgi:hypothetical protein
MNKLDDVWVVPVLALTLAVAVSALYWGGPGSLEDTAIEPRIDADAEITFAGTEIQTKYRSGGENTSVTFVVWELENGGALEQTERHRHTIDRPGEKRVLDLDAIERGDYVKVHAYAGSGDRKTIFVIKHRWI